MKNLETRLADEADRAAFAAPPFLQAMLDRGLLGEKAGRGFYRRAPADEGGGLLVLDPATLEYRPVRPVSLPSLEAARAIDDPGDRIRALFLGRDRVGELLRATLGPALLYAARVAPDIAHSIDDVDRAMRWGFGWELGPFETWDAIGLEEVLRACAAEAPPLVRARLDQSARAGTPAAFRPLGPDRPAGATRRYRLVPPAAPDLLLLRSARERCRVVRQNPGASLVDLGDGVLAVELHSKMNVIGADTIEMLGRGVEEASRHFAALVVGTEAAHFSAGANLMLLLLEAQEGNWEEIDLTVRAFQRANLALRDAPVPVVVAPVGLTLGGGCEILLHGDRAQAAAESYIGLVETGVGLVPAGGGTKEMLARAMEAAPPGATDLVSIVRPVFETIGFAKVSASAADARRLGFLREADGVTMNRERLVHDAKQTALALARDYRPPPPRAAIRVGGEEVLAALRLGLHLAWRAGHISDHDRLVGEKLAWILAGGDLPHPAYVTEQYLLDLEREAFVSLCGERKTQERIAHTLKTGKPLRN
jgi:3-hydroxyacyl-CoA dehydrogenase